MADFLSQLRRLLGIVPRREHIHHTVSHPRLGALRFVGWRLPPNGPVAGHWEVTLAGSARAITVDLASTVDGTPEPGDVAWLEAFLGDLDGFYALVRPAMIPLYSDVVGGEPPSDWRVAFRLDSVNPPDHDEENPDDWQVSYWCANAEHWFVVALRGREILAVDMEG